MRHWRETHSKGASASVGDTVRVRLSDLSVICRVWQHTVPQVTYAEISTEVTEPEEEQIDPGENCS